MSNFDNLVTTVIPELLESLSYENEIFKVEFRGGKYNPAQDATVSDTFCTCVNADINLTNKLTSSYISFRRDLLYVPVMTEMGFKVGKSYKQVLDLYDRAKGWYLKKGKPIAADKITSSEEYIEGNIPMNASVMTFMPVSGRHLTFFYKEGKIHVKSSTKKSCSIGHFLKALTGKSYKELTNLLGTNMYILSSLTDEVSVMESIEKVAPLFLNSKGNRDDNNLAKTVKRLMFDRYYMTVNKASRIRLATASSFSKRALRTELAERITVNGRTIEPGTELQRDLLVELDNSGLATLKVKKDGRVYDLRKYEYSEDEMTPNELFTMINMFACLLDGYGNFDEEYELTARVLVSYEQKVKDTLKEKVAYIINEVANKLDLESAKRDLSLFNIARSINLNNINDIIDDLRDAGAKEIQMADNSNPISFESKNSKVTTSLDGKAPKEMVRIQDTQRGHIDPIESPESSKIGKVHYKTVIAKTDENGFSTVPYIKVKDGDVVSNAPVYLTADETRYEYIAEWNEKFGSSDVSAFYNGAIIRVPKAKVTLMGYSPFDEMGLARSGIPFQNYSNPKRLLMGSNYERQADPIVAPERAIVSTGNEVFLPKLVFSARTILSEYWESNGKLSLKGITREEFIESPIKVIGSAIEKTQRKYDLAVKSKVGTLQIEKLLPFLQRTAKGSSFSYKLNPSKDDVYQGSDIIIYHGGIDIKKYDIAMFADYGHYQIKDEVTGEYRSVCEDDLQTGLALGRNLTVGFTTYEYSNIDDAITIREGLVYENKLTSIIQKEIKEECNSSEDFYENFGFPDNKDIMEPYMSTNGLPKVGTFLKPGSLVIGKYRVVTEGASEVILMRNHYLPNNIAGEVVSAVLDPSGKEAVVTLASLSPIEEGDKIVGRYGNKGVVARIVPDADMPYNAETGRVLDIGLNPLGVPSRMNISQLLESTLGEAMSLQGKISIATPFKDDALEYIRGEADKVGVKPYKMIDGRTGLPIDRPINVGVMYFLKLEHMVDKKIHSINITNKVNPITKQPNQGSKRDGGQAFGEMEVWCLQACNANKVIQDVMSVQSDDVQAQKQLKDVIADNPLSINVKSTNNNDKYFSVMIRSMGANLFNTEDQYNIKPLTDAMCRSFTPNPVDPENIDTIYNNDFFGTPNPQKRRGSIEKAPEDMWSYVNLHCEVVHPLWVKKSQLYQLLIVGIEQSETIKPQPISRDGINKIIEGKASLNFDSPETSFPIFTDVPVPPEGYETGMEALVKLIKNSSLADARAYYEKEVARLKEAEVKSGENKNYFNELVTINAIKMWEDLGIKLDDFVISTLPIMPNTYRPRTKSGMKRKIFANQHYGRIFTAICDVKNAKNNSNIYKVYKTIGEFVGVLTKAKGKDDIQNVEEYYFGKDSKNHGILRESLLKKRQHMTGRSVIIPNGTLTVDQVGVPLLMGTEIWKPHLVSALKIHSPLTDKGILLEDKQLETLLDCISSSNVGKFCRLVGRDGESLAGKNFYFETRKFVIQFLEKQTALFGRQPSLAKFSCRAYRVKITFHKTLELNPMVCKGYNADFDGDQMYLMGLINTEASDEAREKMSARNWVINPKDSTNIMEHGQDMVLGTYYATMLFDNVKDIREDERYKEIHFVSCVEELKCLVETGNIHIHSLAMVQVDGRKYLSTAGRILFNSLLPNGFTEEPFTNNLRIATVENSQGAELNGFPVINPSRYCNLKLDGIMSAKGKNKDGMEYFSLSDYTKQLYYDVDIDTCMDTYQAIMEFGFRYCDVSGLTIGIADLDVKLDLKTPTDQADAWAEKINKWYFDGILSEAGRKSLLISVYNKLTKHLKDNVVFKSLPRNNNIAIILDSGSRGNIDQVMQTIGVIGVSMKTNSESLETPILHAYGSGLTSFEMFLASYGARMGINSTQNETAEAGYATRQTVYMCNGLRVVEEDCGTEDDKYILEYDELSQIRDNMGNMWDDKHLEVYKGATDKFSGATEVLVGKELTESDINEEVRKILLNFLPPTNILNDSCIKQILKHKIRKLECFASNGEVNPIYTITYEMGATAKDLMLHRYLTRPIINKSTGEVLISANHYLTAEDIELIGKLNLSSVNLRTMLTCRSTHGICAKCFGKKFDTLTLPIVGDYVGVESAQAIGEPAAQLSMNVSHKGGIAAGATSGVQYFMSLLEGSVPKKSLQAITSSEGQYVEIKTLGDLAYVTNGDRIVTVPANILLVENGEYANFGDILTAGNIVLDKMGDSRSNVDVIRKRQNTLVKMYHGTFLANNLDVHARHFEVLARVQTTLVQVIESNDPDLPAGQDAELAEVLKSQDNGHEINYNFAVTKQQRVINYFGGPLTGLAFERFPEVLTNLVVKQPKTPMIGVLSKLVVGEDVRNQYDDEGNLLPSKRKQIMQGFNTSITSNDIVSNNNTVEDVNEFDLEISNVKVDVMTTFDDSGTEQYSFSGQSSGIVLDDINLDDLDGLDILLEDEEEVALDITGSEETKDIAVGDINSMNVF